MKKLIYIWVNNYKNLIIQQGYQLSPEIIIHTQVADEPIGQMTLHVHMSDNRANVFPNFYGTNISSVTALVGKNGCGKTMVTRMLLEYLPDALKCNDSLNSINLTINSSILSSWDHRALYMLYDEDIKRVSICANDIDVQIMADTTIHYDNIPFNQIYDELCLSIRSGIYLTNVFNPSELLDSYHKLALEGSTIKFQQTYSPAFLLKHEAEDQTRNLYGYLYNDQKMISVIQKYAQSQMSSLSFAYMNKQAALFLRSFYHIPEKLKKEMHIYQEFGLDVIEFGTIDEIQLYIDNKSYNALFRNLNPADQILIDLKRRYIIQNQSMPDNILLKLYLNMLLEVYGIVYRETKPLKQAIEKVLDNKISIINFDVLNEIRNYLLDSVLKESCWAKQILDFISFLSDKKTEIEECRLIIKTGNHSFEEESIVKWYYEEITKETSFVKRNLIFRWCPTSSGEMAVANLFAYLHDSISNLKSPQGNVLVIFDELDCYLHPRWQQCIFTMLLDQLQSYTQYTFQVVITAHSPIILSDICRDNILKLDTFHAELETRKTFGADITHLYYDSFFMDEGDIGDFAKKNIEYTINSLKSRTQGDEKKLQFIIENIGHDIVSKKLYEDFQKLKRLKANEHVSSMDERINALSIADKNKVEEYIRQIELQAAREKNHDKNTH